MNTTPRGEGQTLGTGATVLEARSRLNLEGRFPMLRSLPGPSSVVSLPPALAIFKKSSVFKGHWKISKITLDFSTGGLRRRSKMCKPDRSHVRVLNQCPTGSSVFSPVTDVRNVSALFTPVGVESGKFHADLRGHQVRQTHMLQDTVSQQDLRAKEFLNAYRDTPRIYASRRKLIEILEIYRRDDN